MKADVKASVIVATYNWPQALRAVLQGFAGQTCQQFEVLIADDGSDNETKQLIQSLTPTLPYPLKHVWHEDKGFRLSVIRNRAAAEASGDYLIFIDGDCVPLPFFIEQHIKLAEQNYFATGSRILLNERFSKNALAKQLPLHEYSRLKWFSEWLKGSVNRVSPLLVLPDGLFRKRNTKNWQGARGCNMAFWKSDYFRVNGFDEDFIGWGREDSDILVRMINAGMMRKDVKFAAPVLHLWHRENDRAQFNSNDQRLNDTIASGRIFADHGVSQYVK